MIQPFRGGSNSLAKQNSSQRPNRGLAEQPATKPRSMSTNKQSDTIAPRFGGSSLFNDDMLSMANPLSMMKGFQSMHSQMMSRFDSMFDMEPFGGFSNSLMKPFDLHSELREMMSFDKIDHPMMGRGNAGKMITRTYVSQTGVGADGKKYKEQYFSHNYAARGHDGTTLSEKQQAYQNTGNNLQKLALEKTLNDKGRKMVKERVRGQGDERTHNFYYGIDENEGDEFERQWMKKSEEIGFMSDFGKPLGYGNYKSKQITDPTYQSANYKPSNRGNDMKADRWGLGYGGSESTGTPKYYTNDDVYAPENGVPRVGRTRANDLMPTMPGRSIGAGPSINNANIRAPEPTNVNVDYGRYNPVRVSDNARPNPVGVDTNGNFKNKNPMNVMPKAG